MSENAVMNLDGKLAALQDTWEKAPAGGNVAEGEYEGEVTDFDFFESKAGELFLKSEITIRLPREYDGIQVETVHSLSHPDRIKFAKEHLAKLGVDVSEVSMGSLIDTLRSVIGTGVAIAIRHNERGGKTYQNVYVNDVLFAPDASPTERANVNADVPADLEGLGASGPQDGRQEFGF